MQTVVEKPEKTPKARGKRNAPPWTSETAPRGGRQKGAVSFSGALKRQLAEVDPSDRAARRTIAEGIAARMTSIALESSDESCAITAAKEIRQATEGDKQTHTGAVSVRIAYVEDWRRGDES